MTRAKPPARRGATAAGKLGAALKAEPARYDFFVVMRALEARHADRPRIGRSATVRDEYVALGQDPFLAFPDANLSRVEDDPAGRLRVLVRFLGLLGPQGALPLVTTEEAYGYHQMRDHAFARFLDLFNNRFLQLFYRAWADVRPLVQHDRPDGDHFRQYVGATIGLGSPIFERLDEVPDGVKLLHAGLLGAQAKSASRLASLVGSVFDVTVEVEQFVGSRLVLEPADRTMLGRSAATLGGDAMLGASAYSVIDKFRLCIFTHSMAEFERLLPSHPRSLVLADLVFFHMGEELDWDVELALPNRCVEPVALGRSGRLGWTSWLGRDPAAEPDSYRADARFHLMERARQRRTGAAASAARI